MLSALDSGLSRLSPRETPAPEIFPHGLRSLQTLCPPLALSSPHSLPCSIAGVALQSCFGCKHHGTFKNHQGTLKNSDDIVPPHLRWRCSFHPHHRDDEAGGNKHGTNTAPGLILPFWAILVARTSMEHLRQQNLLYHQTLLVN